MEKPTERKRARREIPGKMPGDRAAQPGVSVPFGRPGRTPIKAHAGVHSGTHPGVHPGGMREQGPGDGARLQVKEEKRRSPESGHSVHRQETAGGHGAGAPRGKAGRGKKGRAYVTAILIVLGVVALLFAGVQLLTGSSVFDLFSAAFDEDYTPSAGRDDGNFAPLAQGGSSLPGGLTGTPGGSGEDDGQAPAGYDVTRKEGSYNFLVCGVNTLQGMNNSDTMFLLNFNVKSGEVNIVQLPRDAYFSYYKEKHNFHKINSYYTAYYNKAKSDGKENKDAIRAGMTALREFIEDVYCVKVDYYVYLDLKAFVKVVDAVGGVTVDVPMRMDYDDPAGGLSVHLKKGVQHMDGNTALQFVRFRKGYVNSDYGRMDAQKIFMTAFMKQVKENFSLKTAATLATTVFKNLICDIPADDFLYFAKQAYGCDLGKITMQTLPSGGGMAADGLWYDVVCREEAVETINRALNVYKNLPVSIGGGAGTVKFDRDGILYDHDSKKQTAIYFGRAEEGLTDVYTADEAEDKVQVK